MSETPTTSNEKPKKGRLQRFFRQLGGKASIGEMTDGHTHAALTNKLPEDKGAAFGASPDDRAVNRKALQDEYELITGTPVKPDDDDRTPSDLNQSLITDVPVNPDGYNRTPSDLNQSIITEVPGAYDPTVPAPNDTNISRKIVQIDPQDVTPQMMRNAVGTPYDHLGGGRYYRGDDR